MLVLCSDNYIGALGAAVIANALKKNKSLRELHMKGNELGDEGVKAICAALKERQAPVTSLDFGNNKCGSPCIFRLSCLKDSKKCCAAGDNHASAMHSDVFGPGSPDVHQHEETLSVPHPGTLPADVLFHTSKEGRGATLTLPHLLCSLSVEGAEAIADIVKRAHLKELNLYMNDIGDAGILKVRVWSSCSVDITYRPELAHLLRAQTDAIYARPACGARLPCKMWTVS